MIGENANTWKRSSKRLQHIVMKQLVVLDRVESVINQVGSKSTLVQPLSGTCGIMTEKDDGESFCDISRASTEKINFYCIRPDIQREPTHFKI